MGAKDDAIRLVRDAILGLGNAHVVAIASRQHDVVGSGDAHGDVVERNGACGEELGFRRAPATRIARREVAVERRPIRSLDGVLAALEGGAQPAAVERGLIHAQRAHHPVCACHRRCGKLLGGGGQAGGRGGDGAQEHEARPQPRAAQLRAETSRVLGDLVQDEQVDADRHAEWPVLGHLGDEFRAFQAQHPEANRVIRVGLGGHDDELVSQEGGCLGNEAFIVRAGHAHVPVIVPWDKALMAYGPDCRPTVGDVTNVQECADAIDFGQAPLGHALNGCQGCGISFAHEGPIIKEVLENYRRES